MYVEQPLLSKVVGVGRVHSDRGNGTGDFVRILVSPVPEFLNVLICMAGTLVAVEVCLADDGGMITRIADVPHVAGSMAVGDHSVVPYPVLIDVLSAYQ